MLELEYFLYLMVILMAVLWVNSHCAYKRENAKAKKFEKLMFNKLTDFELLEKAIRYINKVDDSNLRPDQRKLWNEYIETKFFY